MPIDLAEQIYRLIGIGAIGIALVTLVWFHRSFHAEALVERPESLSEGHLRRVLSWGKVIYRINANNPKGEEIMRRMRLALAELRRRRGVDEDVH